MDEDDTEVSLGRVQAGLDALALARFRRQNAFLAEIPVRAMARELLLKSKLPVPDPNTTPEPGFLDGIAENNALTGDVYLDQSRHVWFQMSPGATIYHWGKDPRVPLIEAPWQSVKGGQQVVPVFKLVSPDDTGGSRECCIENPPVVPFKVMGNVYKIGKSNIGAVNELVNVANRIVTKPKYQGSYNYSETVVKGLASHEMRDVKPHSGRSGFYVDPPDRWSLLSNRVFPEKDNEDKPLADQV
jgi:hypothetical protein